MKKISLNKLRNHTQIERWISELKTRLKPVEAYFKHLTAREQQILVFGGAILSLMFVFIIFSAALDFQHSLQQDYEYMQRYRLDAEDLIREYKSISQITPNDFSNVTLERVRGDVTQALDVKEPDVTIIDKKLRINVPNTKFSSAIELLNQFRKSYGIFPAQLKITRLSNPGYVSFNASFTVEQDQ